MSDSYFIFDYFPAAYRKVFSNAKTCLSTTNLKQSK